MTFALHSGSLHKVTWYGITRKTGSKEVIKHLQGHKLRSDREIFKCKFSTFGASACMLWMFPLCPMLGFVWIGQCECREATGLNVSVRTSLFLLTELAELKVFVLQMMNGEPTAGATWSCFSRRAVSGQEVSPDRAWPVMGSRMDPISFPQPEVCTQILLTDGSSRHHKRELTVWSVDHRIAELFSLDKTSKAIKSIH